MVILKPVGLLIFGIFSILSAILSKKRSARSPARGAHFGAPRRMPAGAAMAMVARPACCIPVMRLVATEAGTPRGAARRAVANIISSGERGGVKANCWLVGNEVIVVIG
ncbi:hypothetical protein BDZ85DRAFT_270614, partial [Elsinoe ampelina]